MTGNKPDNKAAEDLAEQIRDLIQTAVQGLPRYQRLELDQLIADAIDKGMTLADIMRLQDVRH